MEESTDSWVTGSGRMRGFAVVVWGGLLNQDCVSVTLLLSGRRAGQSRAHPLAGAMERPWAGAEAGAGRAVLVLKR